MKTNLSLLNGLYARVKVSPFDSFGNWILLEDFCYYVGYKGSKEEIHIPAGFIFNGMSIPRLLWWFASPMDSDTLIAALLHDWLFAQQIYTLEKTDYIFYEVLIESGVSQDKAILLYIGLGLGSWHKWNLIRKVKSI